jgi:hypothetical protein
MARLLKGLQAALTELAARYRDPGGRRVAPTLERLRSNAVNLLETSMGLLDAMQRIGAGWTYDDLLPRARLLRVGELQVRVLELASVIESKEAAARDKDLALLPLLRRTLELRREIEGQGNSPPPRV